MYRTGLPASIDSVIGYRASQYYAVGPRSLFMHGEQGTWYDPSDFSTMFQDAAGTTPVTAVEQYVGLMLDKSGRGNHAYQTTSASRPLLSARYNLLTKTEQFDDAVWGKNGATVTANTTATTDPLGGYTADKLVESTTTAYHVIYKIAISVTSAGYTASFYAKAGGRNWVGLDFNNGSVAALVYFDIVNGVVGTKDASFTASITSVGNGWFRCIASRNFSTALSTAQINIFSAIGDNTGNYTGDGISGSYIWGASLVPADQAALPYQRVNTATDYDTVGFKPYIKFDGTDDFLVTNSIDFTATDKMTVWAGVRKLSDAVTGVLYELSSDFSSNAGTVAAAAPGSGGANKFTFGSRGTTAGGTAVTTSSVFAAPNTAVHVGVSSISADLAKLRLNGADINIVTADQGTGNFGNYPLYIGRRAGTTLPFNGQLYSLIIRGAQSTDAQISNTEKYTNDKTGAYA